MIISYIYGILLFGTLILHGILIIKLIVEVNRL